MDVSGIFECHLKLWPSIEFRVFRISSFEFKNIEFRVHDLI